MATREGFVYRGRSADDVDQQANQSSSSYDKIIIDRFPQLKVEKGDHTFRPLPPTFAKTEKLEKKYGNHWGLKIIVHRNVGPKDQTYLCLDAMKAEECPICEFAKELEADGENEDAYQLRQQSLYLAWAIDREDESAGPQVWMVPWTLDRDIGLLCKDKKTNEVLLIDHPDEGYDVDFRREGKGLGTKYAGVRVARDESPIHENAKKQAKWLAFIDENPLTAVLNFFEADYLEKQVKATGGHSDDERSSKKRGSSKRGKDDDDDDKKSSKKRSSKDDDDDDDDDDKPKAKGGGLKRQRVDDDDEDDKKSSKKRSRDDDDDDEDDKPKGKRSSKDDDDDDDDKGKHGKKPARGSDDDDTDDDDKDSKDSKGGKRSSKDDDDDDDDASSKAKGALKRGKRSSKDDDDDDDDDKKSSKKRSSKDDDDDDKPKGKSRRRSNDDDDD